MPDFRLNATVNGRKISRNAKPSQRLLDFLRDDLNLTGNKEGCGAGECGTCSVFVDGVLMKSCLLPVAKVQGARIDSIESLAPTGELTVLQKAFHKAGASQCGYCIPGMVMAAAAALRANPHADREEIKERLGGNICRCTGYQKIFDAVELARDVQNGSVPATALLETDTAGLQVQSFIRGRWESVRMPSIVAPDGKAKLFTGNVEVPIDDSWEGQGRVKIRHVNPTPCTIRAFTPVFDAEP